MTADGPRGGEGETANQAARPIRSQMWKKARRFGPLLLVLVAVIAAFGSGLTKHLSLHELRARREGLLNMEKAMDVEGFLAKGLRMVVDQSDREHIHAVLAQELHATQDRHHQGQEIFRFIALSAPSFGMVGTLIGMVQLFASLKDPSGIGLGMAAMPT